MDFRGINWRSCILLKEQSGYLTFTSLSLREILEMAQKVTPYKNSSEGKKKQVTRMFDNISGEYDRLNRVISFGTDIRWRKRVVSILKTRKPACILDIATGTGDLAIALKETGAAQIVGLDISPGMLDIGKQKVSALHLDKTIEMVIGDSEQLAFADASFDAATVAFGVRNFEDLNQGLSEIYRVLRPGGTLVVLETSVPTRFPFKQGYYFYSRYLLPVIGRIFSRDRSAYRYLSESAASFPYGDAFNNILKEIGFIGIECRPQTFGVASIYIATK